MRFIGVADPCRIDEEMLHVMVRDRTRLQFLLDSDRQKNQRVKHTMNNFQALVRNLPAFGDTA